MLSGKYDTLLFVEHRFYPAELKLKEAWHDRMCTMNKGTYTHLSYNTKRQQKNEMEQIKWCRHTLTVNMRSRMTERGSGGDPTKLGRWTWVCIGGKGGITTVSVSTYRPYKNIDGLNTMWNQ